MLYNPYTESNLFLMEVHISPYFLGLKSNIILEKSIRPGSSYKAEPRRFMGFGRPQYLNIGMNSLINTSYNYM